MNELQTSVNKTMSSVELVEVINDLREAGKPELRHDNFMTKIEKHPGIDSPKFLGQYKDSTGRALKCYHLPKRECELMVMSESQAVQTRVYDRMTELEAQTPALNPANLTRLDLIKLAMQAEQERLLLEAKVTEQTAVLALQAPKVEALDLIATQADGTMCITNAAKYLQAQPKRVFAWLQEHKWVYRRAGGSGFVGYQDKIQQGLLEHKITTVERSDGTSKMCEQVLVTAKGLAKLAGFFGGGVTA